MTTPTPAPCPDGCGQHVIQAKTRTLDAQPHPLAVWNPDGTLQNAHDKIRGLPGHHVHTCAGPPPDVQEALFT